MNLWLSGILVLFILVTAIRQIYGLAKDHLWLIFGGRGGSPNPFKKRARNVKEPLVTSHNERDKVLKQNFSADKIPKEIDAIVVGSGIGGLTVAAILSKMGKKILVLEQHDQAGGCCHTYLEKGYEFDVGIHYIGEMEEGSISRVLVNQLAESDIEWQQMDEIYDMVILGMGEDDPSKRRSYPMHSGYTKLIQSLVERFPSEEKAIYKYFDIVKQLDQANTGLAMLKLLPRFLSNLLISSGLFLWIFPAFQYFKKSLSEVLNELTENKELKAVLAYSYGDYGTIPKEASFAMHSTLASHFANGAYYPVGGASEIAFKIIPTIEAAGGRVLVRACVTDIIMDDDNKQVVGVKVKQGHTVYDILSPMVISDAGLYNTINCLLPPKAVKKYGLKKSLLSRARHGIALMSVFIGLDGTKEELELVPRNFWAFRDENFDETMEEYLSKSPEDVGNEPPPLMFLSFPSAKDPTYNERYPGKSTCVIITATPYKWFEQWKEEKVLHRGQDYEDFKNSIAEQMWAQVVNMYPQLEGRREYFEVGSPLSNVYYLGTQKGEVYGVDHNISRFSLEAIANMRPDIGVPGLYLTGQDILVCGFSGALYGGLLSAMAISKRNLMDDLIDLTGKIRKEKKSKDN